MAIKVDSYSWYEYAGRKMTLHTGHDEQDLVLFKGEVFGLRKTSKTAKTYYVVDKSELGIRFLLEEKDVQKMISNSFGWTGVINGVTARPGYGGKEHDTVKPESKPNVKPANQPVVKPPKPAPVKPPKTPKAPKQETPLSDIITLNINSSNLKEASYNRDTEILTVTFHNGASWEYHDVSEAEVAMLEAGHGFDGSQGKFFNAMIKSVKRQNPVGGAPVMPKEKGQVVALHLQKNEFNFWLDSEQANYNAAPDKDNTTYAIIRRQRVENEIEVLRLLEALKTTFQSRHLDPESNEKFLFAAIARKVIADVAHYKMSSLAGKRAKEAIAYLKKKIQAPGTQTEPEPEPESEFKPVNLKLTETQKRKWLKGIELFIDKDITLKVARKVIETGHIENDDQLALLLEALANHFPLGAAYNKDFNAIAAKLKRICETQTLSRAAAISYKTLKPLLVNR